ncbi:TrkA family potassium uptake protein [Synechococcus sp. CCY9201]|jgi:trk system potassium uptake protein TrkA|uniref:potassium channel family protein n=1 Tax=unclassified Synechococcus TaxID=2626047 RepID=UPI0018CFA889|nr:MULTISPECIES: TrkA family potassium uptake protein [unclassified Synechococcus]MEA5421977.1 TrkA family potassium uptake protein [Synechococcus sp. CCY9202]MEA5472893.1 TrkA family potassium uptake protein [Synechococcus sp. CCY9201]QPN61329.1 TrkA family potassium uptake protein [Synechococcus sp. CBW1002]QPN67999.1 TrkA family potassium uptake protein [Synechococcus sp. CBW1006]CAK6690043.1 Ktr system potassium uptake protein A [Synechococcus sp. CBW1107]
MNQWWQWQGSEDRFEDSFAVIGVGRFGGAVCKSLASAGADVLAIDSSQRAIDELRQADPGIEGRVVDCTDEEALRASGVLDLGTVVVAISEPLEASITATLIAKDSSDSRVKHVIARATSDLHEKMLRRVGADRVVFPSKMQGERLGLELVRPNLLERLRLDDRNSIEEIKVPRAFVGHSLRDINLRKNYNVSVLAAGPQNQLTVNPPASHVLNEGELLVVMGTSTALEALPST